MSYHYLTNNNHKLVSFKKRGMNEKDEWGSAEMIRILTKINAHNNSEYNVVLIIKHMFI